VEKRPLVLAVVTTVKAARVGLRPVIIRCFLGTRPARFIEIGPGFILLGKALNGQKNDTGNKDKQGFEPH
jgi:hypothetical protein